MKLTVIRKSGAWPNNRLLPFSEGHEMRKGDREASPITDGREGPAPGPRSSGCRPSHRSELEGYPHHNGAHDVMESEIAPGTAGMLVMAVNAGS